MVDELKELGIQFCILGEPPLYMMHQFTQKYGLFTNGRWLVNGNRILKSSIINEREGKKKKKRKSKGEIKGERERF